MATSAIKINPIAVTLTRVNNSYVDATSFSRISVDGFGKFGVMHFNVQTTSSLASGSNFIKIGTINPAPIREVDINIPSQSGNATLLVQITASGDINIANTSGTATGTNFFRGVIPLIF